MRTRIYCSIIAAALPLALASGPASAQFVNNYRAVERYNAVAKGSNIAEWHKRLFDDDVKKRLEAVDSLGKEGSEECVKPLIDATTDSDPRVRAKAFDYLGAIGSRRATLTLTQYLFLSDIDRSSKKRVLVALSRIRDPQSVPSLADFIEKTQDDELRCAALYALGEVGEKGSLEVLEEYTESEDPHERRIATDAQGKIEERLAAAPNNQPTILELEKILGPRNGGQ